LPGAQHGRQPIDYAASWRLSVLSDMPELFVGRRGHALTAVRSHESDVAVLRPDWEQVLWGARC